MRVPSTNGETTLTNDVDRYSSTMYVPSTNGETIHVKADGRYSTAVHVQAINGERPPRTSGEKSLSAAPSGLYLESTKYSNVLGAAPIGVHVDGTTFTLNGDSVTYRFHVDAKTGDLRTDHFGDRVTGSIAPDSMLLVDGVQHDLLDRVRRELPDQGRGDFRIPAIRIRQSEGHTVCNLKYRSHTRVKGKPALPGLPSTFGSEHDVSAIIVHLFDEESAVAANLTYSIFPRYNAIARSVSITNQGTGNISVEVLASISVDFPVQELDMITLSGDHMREAYQERRRVQRGLQGFQNSTGFSSHLHNPFLAIALPSTTESSGCAWGFSLVYSGSSAVNVERGSQNLTRVILGLNPAQLSWPLAPGESLSSPECVSVYSPDGLGGMSRALHRLYRNHLMKSRFIRENRPVLLNSWEGLYFDIDHSKIYEMAKESAALGVKLFVMDDGWFGNEYPRISDSAGLGDWVPNRKRFPNGLGPLVNDITQLRVKGSETLRFGIWVEPEMVNPKSNLYCAHPDWVLSAGSYPQTEQRNQLILNLALPEVQNYIILFMTNLLTSAKISYVKWDHNRSMTEIPSPSAAHAHMLGLYKVLEKLTTKFPDVLFEGCAAGGGRFDPGILKFFPQIWTSDNTDAVDRIYIQLGMSLAYPASSMGCHISAVPNHQTHRTTPFSFRAHVAMMGGSFGLELDPKKLLPEEKAALPSLIALAERINPIVVNGDMWRLSSPYESNWPAVQFISEDASQVVLFYFQLQPCVNMILPRVKLQGLAPQSMYRIDEGEGCYSGMVLMNHGLSYSFKADYGSKVVTLTKEPSS